MPNELKNALKASTSHVASNHIMSRQLPAAGSSTVSVMVWTISGIVLASCGGGGGGGGGPTVTGPTTSDSTDDDGPTPIEGPRDDIARVVDGPVEGAAVYFDMDDDGRVSSDERAAQTQNNRPMYMTDANGYVSAPIEYEGHFFIADVDGAIDTATGDTLSGEYQSLSTGGIATPITDLITDRMREESNADAQGVLDDIFGADGLVTVADILDAENYKILKLGEEAEKPTLPSDTADAEEQEEYDRTLAKYKTSVIMKASLALSEIDKDDAFTNLESPTARVDALKQIVDDDPNNDNEDLMERIDARVDAGREILDEILERSKPLAQPDSSASSINEDSVFRFTEDIFGFDDPNGNSDDAAASRFTGIYVKSSVDFSQADDDAHTVNLLYDGSPLSRHEGAESDSLPGNLPPEAGFYYVSYENLSSLSIRPSDDDSGTLELEYYVFDGELWSDSASLEITVREDVVVEVYESALLEKPIEIDSVDLQGYQLTQEYVDNAFFTIDEDGQIRWESVPDYETPRDSDSDNIYQIELSRTNNGETDRIQVEVRVQDIGDPEKSYVPALFFLPVHIADDDLPSFKSQHLIHGFAWKMPQTGPLEITYSINTAQLATTYSNDQDGIAQFHSSLDAALLSFEQAANLKFIEVAGNRNNEDVLHIEITFQSPDAPPKPSSATTYSERSTISFSHRDIVILPEEVPDHHNYIIPHEIGHALGLAHPFTPETGGGFNRDRLYGTDSAWPGNPDYRRDLNRELDSVMAYNPETYGLQEVDIEALQFLYGAPGTNFEGVQSIRLADSFATRLDAGPPTLTEINENTDLTNGIKIADIIVTDPDGGTFGTLEVAGTHAEFFEFRSGTQISQTLLNRELWLVLEEDESLEGITMLEVHVRIAEKHSTHTDDIAIEVTENQPAMEYVAFGAQDLTAIDETVNEGQSVIANLLDLDLGEIDLNEITIGGSDKDQVQIRPTQNGGVLEFVSAPDFEAPEDDDKDNVYEITLYDDLNSIEVDITVIDIPEI